MARVSLHLHKGTVEMGIGAFVGYTYFATSKTGSKFIRESMKIAGSYAAKQLQLTGRTFVTQPAKATLRAGATRAAGGFVIAQTPTIATLVIGGIAFNAIGNTAAVQKTGHIGNPGVLGMGGTL